MPTTAIASSIPIVRYGPISLRQPPGPPDPGSCDPGPDIRQGSLRGRRTTTGHHTLSVKHRTFIHHQTGRTDIALHHRFPFKDELFSSRDGTRQFTGKRHILTGQVPVHHAAETDGNIRFCVQVTYKCTVDPDASLCPDLPLHHGPRSEEAQFTAALFLCHSTPPLSFTMFRSPLRTGKVPLVHPCGCHQQFVGITRDPVLPHLKMKMRTLARPA